MTRVVKQRRTRRRKREPEWVSFDDQQLLDVRINKLGLKLENSAIQPRIERLYSELETRGIHFRPYAWLSDEWFTPDGVPGFAVPFHLAHPRLARLERKQMLEVEGGTLAWCMRILRHETGHAIDAAYRLHRRRKWRETFGKSTQPYPKYYQPKPYSKSYVLHLDPWYAQSHPSEDFAETFAVWLQPRSRWRSRYQGWGALKKLRYVDELMEEIRDTKPLVASRERVDSVRTIRKTLREHYEQKHQRYGRDYPDFYDRDLRRLFSDSPENSRKPKAAAFLRRNRRQLRRVIALWTGQYQYTIDQVLDDMIERCEELDLRLQHTERQTRGNALVMMAVQTMNYLHGGRHRIEL
jgi:hypothetical protein